jgi:hypothetical protein
VRNYTKFFCALVWRDDVPGGAAAAMYFADTVENAQVALDGFNQPPFDAPPYHLQPVFPIYFQLNKANMADIVNAASSLWFVGPDLFKDTNYYLLSDSPRDTWDSSNPNFHDLGDESSSGFKSKLGQGTKPSLSGAGTLLAVLNALPAFAAQLKKNGRVRDAGIVMYAYNQVISGVWSITTALIYLDDNRIFG